MKPKPLQVEKAIKEVAKGYQAFCLKRGIPLSKWKKRRGKVSDYPEDWPEIAKRIKDSSNWLCERCKHPHEVETGYVLTVHHLDGNKANCADWNLAALCQRCHLRIQGRVRMAQGFFAEVIQVSEWFRPHLEGYLKATKERKP